MPDFTNQWGLEKPATTTVGKTTVYNAGLDRIDEGRRILPPGAGEPLGPHHLCYVASGGWVLRAVNTNRPLAGFLSSSGSAISTVGSGAAPYLQVDGHIVFSTWAWTPGLPIYAHASAAGSLTQTVPGSLAWPIAVAISSHRIFILPGGLAEVASQTLINRRSATLVCAGVASGTNASIRLIVPVAGAIQTIKSTVRAAPTSDYVFDINKNGTTLYTTQANRPTRIAGDGTGAKTHTAPDVTALAAGDVLDVDVDSAGASISDPTFFVEYNETY